MLFLYFLLAKLPIIGMVTLYVCIYRVPILSLEIALSVRYSNPQAMKTERVGGIAPPILNLEESALFIA